MTRRETRLLFRGAKISQMLIANGVSPSKFAVALAVMMPDLDVGEDGSLRWNHPESGWGQAVDESVVRRWLASEGNIFLQGRGGASSLEGASRGGSATLEETEHFDKLPEKRKQEVLREIRRIAHGAEPSE